MTNTITNKGKEAMMAKLAEKQEKLKDLQKEKAHAYEASGDGWHDNPGWTQLGQQEEMLAAEIAKLQQQISNLKVVDPDPENISCVQVGLTVTFEQFNKKTGVVKTFSFVIGAEGEADSGKRVISCRSPLGIVLVGMKIGECREVQLPIGAFEVRVTNLQLDL